jgi:hypothetical protein
LGVQSGADEVLFVAVFSQGDETPPRGEPLVVLGFAGDVKGFDVAWLLALLKSCPAARMPASTPSRRAAPVSENAF